MQKLYHKNFFSTLLCYLLPLSLISHESFFLISILTSIYGFYLYIKNNDWKLQYGNLRFIRNVIFLIAFFTIVFLLERLIYFQDNSSSSFLKPFDSHFRLIVLIPILFFAYKSEINKKALATGFLLFLVGAFFLSIYQANILNSDRAFGLYTFYNLYAFVILISVLLAFAVIEKNNFVALSVSIISGLATCLLTGTRGVIIIIPVLLFLGFVYLLKNKTYFKKILLYILLLVSVAIAAFTYIPKKFTSDRYNHVLNDYKMIVKGDGAATSIGARLEMWRIGGRLIQSAPFFGGGLGSFRDELKRLVVQKKVPDAYATFQGPHNLYILTLAEHGVFLGSVFLVFVFGMPFYIYQKLKNSSGISRFNSNALILFVNYLLMAMIFFMSESVIERHQGMQYFSFIWLFFIGYCFKEKNNF